MSGITNDEEMDLETELLDDNESEGVSGRRVGRRGPGASAADRSVKTRGRPAVTPIIDDEDDDGSTITRRSRHEGGGNDFDIPQAWRRPGWDYQWITISVINQPVDGAELNRSYEGGWRPVPAKQMSQLCPPGYAKDTIERYGQLLMMRPMRLTIEAKREEYDIAEKQKRDKLMAASAFSTGKSSMPSTPAEVTIVGVTGVHRQVSAA